MKSKYKTTGREVCPYSIRGEVGVDWWQEIEQKYDTGEI